MQDIGHRARELRLAAGLTQSELAERAEVSRALVGALEQRRHVPAADAAIRLARALGTSVERLFDDGAAGPGAAPVPVLGGELPDGALVRAAWVANTVVARVVDGADALGGAGASADGVVRGGVVEPFAGVAPHGAVIAGCDPVLGIAEGLLERGGEARIVGVPATSGQALAALEAGRCHGALVHGPRRSLRPPPGVLRWHLARWRSGIASHPRRSRPSLEALLEDRALIRRDRTAASQQAVVRAARRLGGRVPTSGRTAGGHLHAARLAVEHEGAAVAIEPVALAMGLDFLELEIHDVELWVPARWTAEPGVQALLDLLSTASFLDRAGALPAYDLSDTGAAR